jgi:hypothetical protein
VTGELRPTSCRKYPLGYIDYYLELKMTLRRMSETVKGIVYFSADKCVDGGIIYRGYLSLKTNIGSFTMQSKVFRSFLDCSSHVEELKFDLLNYDNDAQSYLRMFV